jgi:ubiquinone/menaquinone biosynthesis C-methylase UbiE
LPDRSFDAVINIESSHLYARFPRFLAEAARVLRPSWQDVIVRLVPAFLRSLVRGYSPARRAYEELQSGGSKDDRMYCIAET